MADVKPLQIRFEDGSSKRCIPGTRWQTRTTSATVSPLGPTSIAGRVEAEEHTSRVIDFKKVMWFVSMGLGNRSPI
jgi:hypothetical protein